MNGQVGWSAAARSTVAAAVAAALLSSTPSYAAPSHNKQVQAVQALLQAHHPRITVERLRAIGPDVASILRQEAARPGNGRAVARALALLVHFPGSASGKLLRAVSADSQRPTRIRRIACVALIVGQGATALKDARRLLQHRDAHLRDGVAHALGSVPHPRATSLLVQRQRLEREAFVLETIARSIKKHRAAARSRKTGGAPARPRAPSK